MRLGDLTLHGFGISAYLRRRVIGRNALGVTVTFGAGRTPLTFGTSKINLHEAGRELESKALRPTPGSAHVSSSSTTTSAG
jgi:hypothetical protein